MTVMTSVRDMMNLDLQEYIVDRNEWRKRNLMGNHRG